MSTVSNSGDEPPDPCLMRGVAVAVELTQVWFFNRTHLHLDGRNQQRDPNHRDRIRGWVAGRYVLDADGLADVAVNDEHHVTVEDSGGAGSTASGAILRTDARPTLIPKPTRAVPPRTVAVIVVRPATRPVSAAETGMSAAKRPAVAGPIR